MLSYEDNIRDRKELKVCCDKCCGDFPHVMIRDSLIVVMCMHKNCNDGKPNKIVISGTGEQTQLKAMLDWNHLIRSKK